MVHITYNIQTLPLKKEQKLLNIKKMSLTGRKCNFIKNPSLPIISKNSRVMNELAVIYDTTHTYLFLYSALMLCVLKWLGQEVLSHCTSIGWLLIHLGLWGSGVSRLGWAGCPKWSFYSPWGSPPLMDPGKWQYKVERQSRAAALTRGEGRTVTVING